MVFQRESLEKDLEVFNRSFRKDYNLFAVRSSSSDEDQEFTNAGKYLSILNVKSSEIENAVARVLQTYPETEQYGEVLVQPMLTDAATAGVLFTTDPNTGSKYNVINLNLSGETDAITSGIENGQVFVAVGPESPSENKILTKELRNLILVSEQISDEYDSKPLDIEFAISKSGTIWILQVRILQIKKQSLATKEFRKQLDVCHDMVKKVSSRHPSLYGDETCLSVMTDWNPAELIGVRPTQLAISLFKELISDNIWAYERSNFGYRNMRSFPLMIEIAGQPFIDVRVSFNSLMPSGLTNESANELASHYLSEFKDSPEKHDKVEFELYFSSYTATTRDRLSRTSISNNSKVNIVAELLKVTSSMIKSSPYGLSQSMSKAEPLEQKLKEISESLLPNSAKIYWLIENCKRYGTLPFSGVARCAFVGLEILKSFVEDGTITQLELDLFLQTIESLPSKLGSDSRKLPKDDFLLVYGHLRPGTFDIRNCTYAENYESYFNLPGSIDTNRLCLDFPIKEFTSRISNRQEKYLTEIGVTAEELLDFCRTSIKEREDTKFRFSKHISKILDYIIEVGKDFSITRDELAHLDVKQLLKIHSESVDIGSALRGSIEQGRQNYKVTEAIWLPSVIKHPDEVYEFQVPQTIPNFVTQEVYTGFLKKVETNAANLAGKIVLVESADPGFDWIFTHQIGGLVTSYGGVNSHMAVRAYELNIPAAIGVGEQMFKRLSQSSTAFLDCPNKRIEILE